MRKTGTKRRAFAIEWRRLLLAAVYGATAVFFGAVRVDLPWLAVSLALALLCLLASAGPAVWQGQPGMARAASFLADVPLLYLALPLPLMASWTAGQIALVPERFDDRPAALSDLHNVFRTDPKSEPNYWQAFGMWLGSIALFVGILAPWPWVHLRNLGPKVRKLPWIEVGAVSFLTLAAFAARVIDLVDAPSPFAGDEANFGIGALWITNGVRDNMFSAADPWGQPTLYHFIIAGFSRAFGTGILAVRLPSVLFGTTMIPLLYLLLREQFDRRVALVGAAFLAVFAVHIHFSRVGYNNISAAWIGVLALLFAARSVRTRKPLDFGLAGAAAGLSLYSYAGARVIPIVLAIYFAWVVLVDWRFLRDNIANFLLLLAGFAIVAAPQGLFFIDQPRRWSIGQDQTNIFQNHWLSNAEAARNEGAFTIMVGQFKDAFAVLVIHGERFIHFNSERPLLDILSRVLFVIGGAMAVLRIRQPRYFIHLALLIVTVIMGAVVIDPPPSAARLVAAIPALAAFVAIGTVGIGDGLARVQPRLSRAVPVASVAVVCVIAVLNLQFYFGDYVRSDRFVVASANQNDAFEEAGNYVDGLGPGYAAFLFGPQFFAADPTVTFLARGRTLIDVPDGGELLPDVATDEPNATFIVAPERQQAIDAIRADCPGGEVKQFRNPHRHGELYFLAYEVVGGRTCVRERGVTAPVALSSRDVSLGDASARDERRRADLEAIATALQRYETQYAILPRTDGEVMGLCIYPEDPGCSLHQYLDPIPADPLGDAARNGYFYASDGVTYSLFAILEDTGKRPLLDCPYYDADSLPRSTEICVTGP